LERQAPYFRKGIFVSVFVVGKSGKPLMPCSEKRARLLLDRGQAVVINIDYPYFVVDKA